MAPIVQIVARGDGTLLAVDRTGALYAEARDGSRYGAGFTSTWSHVNTDGVAGKIVGAAVRYQGEISVLTDRGEIFDRQKIEGVGPGQYRWVKVSE